MQPLEGIAQADAHLGRRMPLPTTPLPLVRWVDIHAAGPGAVEIAWSLDDSREGAPGRLALLASTSLPAPREIEHASAPREVAPGVVHRMAPLAEAQPSLRPVQELHWTADDLYLRMTAQGPWSLADLLAIISGIG